GAFVSPVDLPVSVCRSTPPALARASLAERAAFAFPPFVGRPTWSSWSTAAAAAVFVVARSSSRGARVLGDHLRRRRPRRQQSVQQPFLVPRETVHGLPQLFHLRQRQNAAAAARRAPPRRLVVNGTAATSPPPPRALQGEPP
ncbi:unnamed protein product, partial [Ectocarpus sp. 13 AM-2016]